MSLRSVIYFKTWIWRSFGTTMQKKVGIFITKCYGKCTDRGQSHLFLHILMAVDLSLRDICEKLLLLLLRWILNIIMCLWQHWMPVAIRSTNTYTLIYNFICITAIIQGEKKESPGSRRARKERIIYFLKYWSASEQSDSHQILVGFKDPFTSYFFYVFSLPVEDIQKWNFTSATSDPGCPLWVDINYNCYSAHILLIVNILICVNKSFYITS